MEKYLFNTETTVKSEKQDFTLSGTPCLVSPNTEIMRLIDYLSRPDTREFIAVFHEVNEIELRQFRFKMTDNWDLTEDTLEVRIAICEKVSEIDLLDVGQSCAFNPIRDVKITNGFILRMK